MRSEFRPEIQGLRGIAVLLVVLYHAQLPFLPGGFVGVDVFFVISGYLITGLIARELIVTGTLRLANFWARRARRLLPAAWLLITAVLAATAWAYPPMEQTDIFSAGRAAALYLINLWFTFRAVDYLGGAAATNPLLHMWSLAVEEQFYVLWPLLLLAAARGVPTERLQARLVAVVGGLSLVSLVVCVAVTWRSQPWAFFGMPFRAWEFGIGGLLWLLRERVLSTKAAFARNTGLAGTLLIAFSVTMLDESSLFPGAWALLPAVGTALVILALEGDTSSILRSCLASRPLAWLGDLSYSWYLWHWPVLVFAELLFPAAGVAAKVAAVALSLALAEASYRLVENPVRYSRRLARRDGAIISAALATSCGFALAATLLLGWASGDGVPQWQQKYAAARRDIPVVYSKGCHVDLDAVEHPPCVFGNPRGNVTVVLFGDSHAAHWFPALERLAGLHDWRLVSLTKSSCPSVDVKVFSDTKRREYFECEDWRRNMMQRIALEKPAFVLLANSSRYDRLSEWEAGVTRTLRQFAAGGVPVVVMRDTPWPERNVPVCLARTSWIRGDALRECGFGRERAMAPGVPVWEAESRAVAGGKGDLALDLTGVICPAERCSVVADNIVRYSDRNHMSASYSASLAPVLEERLREWAARTGPGVQRIFAGATASAR